MTKTEIKLPFGFRDGQLLHVSEVESGLMCGCVCASCKQKLVAKKGELTTHHFAHHRSDECERAVETALHLAAKQVLSQFKRITLPRVLIGFDSFRPPIAVTDEREFNLDTVVLENRLGTIIPDIIAYVRNVPLLVEIKVTHGIDQVKAERIKELGVSAIEIDLSRSLRNLTFEELSEFVIENTSNKRWIYNLKADTYRRALFESAEIKRKIFRQSGTQVDNCPINKKVWNGKSYANVNRDCFNCRFLVELRQSDIVCGGRLKIRTKNQIVKYLRRRSSTND